jgi:chemotaxis protein CheD
MCHYLLAHRHLFPDGRQPNGYFASDAVGFFVRKLRSAGVRPEDCAVRLFGGGNMLGEINPASRLPNVAQANIEAGASLLEQAGFRPQLSDVGGTRYRKLYFDLCGGDVWVQYGRSRPEGHPAAEKTPSRRLS